MALLNPNTKTCPIFRTRRDADLTKSIYRRIRILIDENRERGANGAVWQPGGTGAMILEAYDRMGR